MSIDRQTIRMGVFYLENSLKGNLHICNIIDVTVARQVEVSVCVSPGCVKRLPSAVGGVYDCVCAVGRWRGGSQRASHGSQPGPRRCPRKLAAGAPRGHQRTTRTTDTT